MAESRTWAIIQALAAQLATITVANGYLTDVGLNVWTNDAQRPSEDALGLMIYSESIVGVQGQRPGKPVRQFGLLVEAAIDTALDDAQQQIHNVIEDVDACLGAYAKQQAAKPTQQATPMAVADIAILDRPEGEAVIAMQARITTEYFR